MYHYDYLEWEITTACNAACPQCPRNYYGGKTWPTLPIVQVDTEWAQTHLSKQFVRSLQTIDFCGTYGDPIMNNNLLSIIEWLRSINSNLNIIIKTNGGIRDTEWWEKLATTIGNNGSVFFGIDGLADTNHLYRRNVEFDTVIKNATAFINAGGAAIWAFIVFQHNQHQVEQARELSQKLGFKNFNPKLTSRFFNKNHEMVDSITVYNRQSIPEYDIHIPSDPKYVNQSYSKINFYRPGQETKINCKVKELKRIYLAADGTVFPCGWLHDRLYGFEAEQHSDYQKLQNLFDSIGGKMFANINHTPIDQIVNGSWFRAIENSWSDTTNRLQRCEVICGNQLNLIADQNQLVNVFK